MHDRHDYRPPRYPLRRSDDPAAAPAIPLLTDPEGETRCLDAATIRLSWTPQALQVHAQGVGETGFLDPSLPPEHPHFWRQDGIELHLDTPSGPFQLILVADGRCFDNRGLGLAASGRVDNAGWHAQAAIAWTDLGIATPAAGLVIRGQVVHTCWHANAPTMAGFAATALGHGQRERFGDFVLAGAAGPRLVEVSRQGLRVTDLPGDGRLGVTVDGATTWHPLGPGEATLPLALDLQRPRFTSLSVAWESGGATIDLGAVSLRAPVPNAPATLRPHPRLLIDAPTLAACRAALANPVFADILASAGGVPDWTPAPSPADNDFSLAASDIGSWFRFCKETLLRDGQRRPRSIAGRIWDWLTPPAREAAARVVATVGGDADDIAILLADLNASVDRHDFYDADLFGPDAARHVAVRGLTPPSAGDDLLTIRRFNRLIMQGLMEFIRPCGGDWLAHIGGCLLPWIVDGDPRWVQRATDCVRAALAHTLIPYYTELHPGMRSSQLALVYDTFAPHLSEADHTAWRELLGRLLAMYLRTARERHWNCTTIANANSVCNSGGGLIALVLHGHDPRADEALRWARKYMWRYLDYCYGTDGGCTEGVQYFEYGATHYLRFARCLQRAVGTDDGLIDNPVVRRWTANITASLCCDGKLHGVNDTIPAPVGHEIAWYLGTRFGDDLALRYGDHALRIQADMAAQIPSVPYRPDPLWALLTRPDTPLAHDLPALPTAIHLPSIEVATLRSQPRWDCTISAGLKGSRPPYTHHNQPDTGSLYLDIHGERLLIDPGYYKDAPTDHCLPVIDGIAPQTPHDLRGHIDRCETIGLWRIATVDSTAAYRGHATRVRRHLILAGPATAIVIDDIAVPAGSPGHIRSWWQAGGPTTQLSPTSLQIAGTATALRLQVLTPPAPANAENAHPAESSPVAITLHPERDLHDTHWGYHFALCRHFPVTIDYTADPAAPFILLITDPSVQESPCIALATQGDGYTLTVPAVGTLAITRSDSGLQIQPLK